ncbi:MAG: PIN domain-containing protein [Actinobacteria bacterium]|nr:PIN domain-containing protein [Actinomycetota bacterium]
MTLLAVIDTNVVVSGVLAGAGPSPNGRILDAMVAGRLRLVLSEVLLAEYRRVLLRPAIARRHGLTEVEVDQLLESLVVHALFREPPALVEGDPPAGDIDLLVPGDEHVVSLLGKVPGAVLVTGDRRLREAVASRYSEATPAEFAAGRA